MICTVFCSALTCDSNGRGKSGISADSVVFYFILKILKQIRQKIRFVNMGGGYTPVFCVILCTFLRVCNFFFKLKSQYRAWHITCTHNKYLWNERLTEKWHGLRKQPSECSAGLPSLLPLGPRGRAAGSMALRRGASLSRSGFRETMEQAQLSRFWGKMILNSEFYAQANTSFKCEHKIKTLSAVLGFRKYTIQAPSQEE